MIARRARWVWLLCLSLLAQALIPVQAHSRWQQDADGRVVVICTLQGTRTLHLDPATGQPQPADSHSGHSPAMAFAGVLAHAAPAPSPLSLPSGNHFALPEPEPVRAAPPSARASASGIRGPPTPGR